MEAYIRIGNESVIAPSFVLNQLILKGMNRTYDILISEYNFKDYAFSKLRERYKVWTGNSMEDKLFDSFDIRNEHGKLTNAGALLADDSPIRHSRLFCTRWNGLDKSGGMADGTKIQERDISNISSTRRNPVLADIFGRLGYMERQGSGFKKITESYHAAHNYREELEPKFYSDVTSFKVTLYNLNYGTITTSDNISIEDGNIAVTTDHVAIEVAIDGLNASQSTIKKVKAVYKSMGIDGIFGRSDISSITGDSVTAAGNLINKLKTANLIVPVKGYGKGKYRFIELHK
ncbi:MAG: ATP-binding protein [Oliverpabstia sp.]|nr:ATP-binding protein [Oliverpabstia sp.]